MMTKTPIHVGLIGYGMAGQVFHAPTIDCVRELDLVKIKTTNPAAIDLAHERYPNTEVVPENDDILLDPAIDLVVVATPNQYHFPLAKKSIDTGKHVVVDKPFTITSQEALELIALAREKDIMLSVYHNRRWDGGFLTVRRLLEREVLGQIVEAEIHFDRFRQQLKGDAWREVDEPGAGVFYDLGPHLIDEALQLFGDPVELHADVRRQRSVGEVDDYFQLDLFYDNLKVLLKAGVLVKEPGPHYILHGTNGSYVKYGLDVQEAALKEGKTPKTLTPWGTDPKDLWGTLNILNRENALREKVKTESGNYVGYYQNIANALSGSLEPAVSGYDGYKTIKIIELAFKSHREKRRIPVTFE